MSAWEPLLPAAMVGTDRTPNWTLPATGEIGAMLQQLASTTSDPATRLLRSAAVLAVCGAAGASAVATAGEGSAAPDDSSPVLPDPASLTLLSWVLREAPARLQHIALQRLAKRGWRLPVALLPATLEVGRRSIALRPPVLGAIGARGRWLAALNPDWRYAVGVSDEAPLEERWAHGSMEQRRVVLLEERGQRPHAARERLAAELPQLAARERADLIGTMTLNLSMADEPWLDSVLRDRSREVRQVVSGLLLRLPDSGFVQRAAQRLEPLLTHEKGFLRSQWKVDAPSQVDSAWETQGIELDRPKHEQLGERAWWLYQLSRQVPVSWWCERMGCTAVELLAWAGKTDWTQALLRAWRDALLHTAESDAIDAMLEGWPWDGLTGDPATLVALLPLSIREKHWQRRLKKDSGELRSLLPELLAACATGEQLSAPLSDVLASALRKTLADAQIVYDHSLRSTLPDLCCALHDTALAGVAGIAPRGDETPAHAELLHTLRRVIEARRSLDQLPSAGRAPR